MGSTRSTSRAGSVLCETQADWQRYIDIIQRNVPRWAARHRDFESVANECLADAIRSFDETRGVPFEGFLAGVARRRMPGRMIREGGLSFVSLDEIMESDPQAGGEPWDRRPDPFEASVSTLEAEEIVESFLATLSESERFLAVGLAAGYTGSDLARARGVGRSAISNSVSVLRPKAKRFWEGVDIQPRFAGAA